MAPLPRPHSATTEAIYAAYAKARSQAWDSIGISISLLGEECERALWCQSAFDWDPLSASKRDPFDRRALLVALGSSELVGVAETARARVV
ncbi:hypothetical protein AB7M69_003504 [Bradyrhizobium japonicum]